MSSLWKTPLLGPLVFWIWRLDARRKLEWVRAWLSEDARHLEIGSGPGSVLMEFRRAGFHVDGLDIADSSYTDDLKPELYDGGAMPYQNGAYDTALALTMLHHTPDPEDILKEAARVSRRIIIIEDVYNSAIQRKYTKAVDSLTNLEFFGHPHTNRSDAEWRETFERLGWRLVHTRVYRLALLFRQAVYILEADAPKKHPSPIDDPPPKP